MTDVMCQVLLRLGHHALGLGSARQHLNSAVTVSRWLPLDQSLRWLDCGAWVCARMRPHYVGHHVLVVADFWPWFSKAAS